MRENDRTREREGEILGEVERKRGGSAEESKEVGGTRGHRRVRERD